MNMDESWRIRMGMNIPRRRSTEETSSDRMRRSIFGLEASDSSQTLKPEDFQDVFGGPPRSIFFRQFSGDLTASANRSGTSESFYEEIFRLPESFVPTKYGRNLPAFRIPSARKGGGGGVGGFRRSDGFYDDIFGSDDDRRLRSRSKSETKSKSKSNSSSVLSSEDLSPLPPPISEDVGFSSFASKLRPINVPCRRNSSSVTPEEQQKRHGISVIPCNRASHMDFKLTDISHESFRSTHFGFSRQVPSPESINLEPIPNQRIKMSVDNVEDPDSPRSAISSLYREPEAKFTIQGKELHDQEEDEVMSSYVIEITPNKMEGTDHGVVDEAIAWAKEKFLTQSLEGLIERSDQNDRDHFSDKEERRIKLDQRMDPAERMQFLTALEGSKDWTMGEEKLQSRKDVSFL
ncbi:hypothetical protein NE237_032382 [Protea cynaroides]|uniref:Uncharacterized protein n=1 Tax=Protea cynaroides TaxID=273540 RepID=A0A9Q0L3E7_9MAGN|nr:hypothetical protein NE237_032382 [Protea cynaroides]